MNYFKDCKTIHEAKQRFRELAKKHHPDHGGDSKTFAEISNQMDAFNPSTPEHSNYFRASGGYAFNASDAIRYARQSFGNSGYQHHVHVPFDHPIHEELREAKKLTDFYKNNLDIMQKNLDSVLERLNKKNQETTSMGYELISCKAAFDLMKKEKDEHIETLRDQIKALKSKESIVDKIRSYFEK